MAGSAGHILSPWEDRSLTFEQIKKLIKKSLRGELLNISEKLDGQNIMVTFRKDEVYIARTPKQLQNYGLESIRWDSIKEQMKTIESKEAYDLAAMNLSIIFMSLKDLSKDIFKEGEYWLNMELITPLMENIIPYGSCQLRVHNLIRVNEKGKAIETISVDSKVDEFLNRSKQIGLDKNITYSISKTNKVIFKKITESVSNQEKSILSKLKEIKNKYNLSEQSTINDFLSEEIKEYLVEWFEYLNIKDMDLLKDLINRWVFEDKTKNITSILKDKDKEIANWVKEQESFIEEDIINYRMEPWIELFSLLGVAVLSNLEGLSTSDFKKSKEKIYNKTLEAISKAIKFIDFSEDTKKEKFVRNQLRRLELAGGIKTVLPIEGIVFEFDNKTFKLTGSYLPILKIISFFQFGRDQG
jgi:hypothetical protein